MARRTRARRRNPLTKNAKIALGVVVLAAAGGAYYLYTQQKAAAAATTPTPPTRNVGGATGTGPLPAVSACDAYHNALQFSFFPADVLARLKAECIASGGTP